MCKVQLLLFLSILYRMTAGTLCNYFEDTSFDAGFYYPTDVCIEYYDSIYNTSEMYACSADGKSVMVSIYSMTGCNKHNLTSNYTVTQGEANYQFLCSGKSCAMALTEKVYTSTDCSGSVSSYASVNWVSNVCYNSSASVSSMYTCSSSSYTVAVYSNGMCTGSPTASVTYSGCYKGSSSSLNFQ